MAESGAGGILVSLVRAAGSTYRLPGARLFALPGGRTAGTISGGCLEADLLRKAHWRVREGAALQRYDTAFEDTAEVPFGLGCGGAVDLLLEAVGRPEGLALLQAMRASLQGEARVIVDVLPEAGQRFARMVLDVQGDVLFASEALATDEIVSLRTIARSQTGGAGADGPETAGQNGGIASRGNRAPGGIFVDELAPAQRLVIFGAGEDARPLVRMAAEMGWTVIVADGRPQHARSERFPQAAGVLVAENAAAARVTAADAVVVMTHSYEQDRRTIAELLPLSPRYLGLLGARHRSALLLREASIAAGLTLAQALERVHAPIGLELGGDGPEKIALAIVSEIQHALHAPESPAGQPAPLGMSIPNRRMSLAQAGVLLEQFGAALPIGSACALEIWPIEGETAPGLSFTPGSPVGPAELVNR